MLDKAMTDARLDRRVQRTRALLREALFALISEKGYTAITIQDITDRANVNRVTFYFHYKDKEDLLFTVMQELYDDLAESVPPKRSLHDKALQDNLLAFQHVQEYAHLYKILFSEKGAHSLMGRLIDYFAQEGVENAAETIPASTTLPLPLVLVEHFYAGAFVALVRWWVLHDMPYSPHEMAAICHQLEVNSGLWAWGLNSQDLDT
jgi:AcrR family transcriptional regulator